MPSDVLLVTFLGDVGDIGYSTLTTKVKRTITVLENCDSLLVRGQDLQY